MKNLKNASLALFVLAVISLLLVRCNKQTDVKKNEEKNLQAIIEKKLATEGITTVYPFSPGEFQSKTSGRYLQNGERLRENTFCNAMPSMNLINYQVIHTPVSGCNNGYTQKVRFDFSITFSQTVNFLGFSQSNPILIFTHKDNSTSQISGVTLTQTSSSGNTYFFSTSLIDIEPNLNYCDLKGFYFEVWPLFSCNGSGPFSTDVSAWVPDIATFDRCKTISPVTIFQSGTTEATFYGVALICRLPCNFIGSQEFELDYRPVGTSTWTTLTKTYFGGPYTIFNLTPGTTHEYRYRNKMNTSTTGTTAPCYGPYSSIGTF